MGLTCSCRLSDGTTVTFSARHFASGQYRCAHHGNYRDGTACVIKTYKSQRYANFVDDVKVAKIAKEIADKFNAEPRCKRPITFLVPKIGRIESVGALGCCACGRLRRGDVVTVEPLLRGKYEKFVSNNGTYRFQGTLTAFVHYSYFASKGRLLVCDLQGVRQEKRYVLTDPAIHSVEQLGRGYGELDLGSVGIEAFFSTHKCEKLCRHLPRPAKARYTTLDCEEIIRQKKRSAYVVMDMHSPE